MSLVKGMDIKRHSYYATVKMNANCIGLITTDSEVFPTGKMLWTSKHVNVLT
jgi:hypothetical protein